MPREELPPVSLQENILAALLFDERAGAAISAQVTPSHFDENYREIAEKSLAYRRKYSRAPGLTHLDDLFGKLLSPGRAPRLRRVVFELAELAKNINGDYVVASTQDFIREQNIKGALVSANSRYEMGGEDRANDVENILSAALRFRTQTLDAGTFLGDRAKAARLFERKENGIPFGIDVFKDIGLTLNPGEQTLFIAPKGSGKSWFCVHVGVMALLLRYRILHVSLEMSELKVMQRYYQRLWTAGVRANSYVRTMLEFDRRTKELSGLRTRKNLVPRWNFAEAGAKLQLDKRIKQWGSKLDRLVVKFFPSGQLTMSQLEGYLDYLELQHKFIPNLLIIDYPDLMKQDSRDLRVSIGRTFVDLRGVAGDRGMALLTPTQGNRGAIGAKRTRSTDVSEDISKVFTADNVITLQRTEEEKAYGLARLLLENARDISDGLEVLITQSYATGQFCLQSTMMEAKVYWDSLAELTGEASRRRAAEARDDD